jgi:RNA polymerase sigma-70 factor (ECF subfamily)
VCAWNDFFGEIRKYLHAQVRQLTANEGSAPLDYSDLVQSALLRVWERIGDQFPNGVEDATLRRFLGWAKKIVQNRGRDKLRRPRRGRMEAVGSDVERVADARPQQPSTRRDQIAAAMSAALNQLGETERRTVEFFWFEKLSDEEIGQRLGCSAGAARVRRFRALDKLCSPELQSLLEDSHVGRC